MARQYQAAKLIQLPLVRIQSNTSAQSWQHLQQASWLHVRPAHTLSGSHGLHVFALGSKVLYLSASQARKMQPRLVRVSSLRHMMVATQNKIHL